MESVRIRHRDALVPIELILRLVSENAAGAPDPHGEGVDVLNCIAPDAHPFALLPIAALGPVVLRQAQLARPRFQEHALERGAVAHLLDDDEPEDLRIEAHATLDVIDGEGRFEPTQAQGLALSTASLSFHGRGALSVDRGTPLARRLLPDRCFLAAGTRRPGGSFDAVGFSSSHAVSLYARGGCSVTRRPAAFN